MKKFILTLIITLIFSASAFAASSDDIYVRKDVFDVHMQNINSKLELILSEMQSFKSELKAQGNEIKSMRNDINELAKSVAVLSERVDRNFETLSARINGVDTSLSNRIEGIDNRISDLRIRDAVYLVMVILGIIVALPNIQKFFQWREAHKPAFTLEDVERLIDAKLSSRSQ